MQKLVSMAMEAFLTRVAVVRDAHRLLQLLHPGGLSPSGSLEAYTIFFQTACVVSFISSFHFFVR